MASAPCTAARAALVMAPKDGAQSTTVKSYSVASSAMIGARDFTRPSGSPPSSRTSAALAATTSTPSPQPEVTNALRAVATDGCSRTSADVQ